MFVHFMSQRENTAGQHVFLDNIENGDEPIEEFRGASSGSSSENGYEEILNAWGNWDLDIEAKYHN